MRGRRKKLCANVRRSRRVFTGLKLSSSLKAAPPSVFAQNNIFSFHKLSSPRPNGGRLQTYSAFNACGRFSIRRGRGDFVCN
jgi:hypothetical protein